MKFLILGTALLAMVIGFFSVSAISTRAAGGPTVYAIFKGDVKGVVEVQQFMSGAGSTVTARIKRPESGVVGFCLYPGDGSRVCQTVNTTFSTYNVKVDKGCVTFTITFSEPVTMAAITDENFVEVKALASFFEPVKPKGVGILNPCR